MPITYQRLGNSGGGMVVEISAYPNTQITLSNEKNTYIKTTDEKGKAVFKGLKAGAYTAMCTVNGKQFTQSITLVDTIKAGLPSAQIKGLPLKSKIKLSNGIKMILMNKNLSGHPANSATFVSEYIVEEYPYGNKFTYKYSTSNIHLKLLPSYYNALTAGEKASIIRRSFTPKYYLNDYYSSNFPEEDQTGTKNDSKITTNFYLPSETEVNAGTLFKDGVNFGFPDNASRIKKYENGNAGSWYIRNAEYDQSDGEIDLYRAWQCFISTSGTRQRKDMSVNDDPSVFTAGIVPCCDISQDAYVALDSDGYYRILGM